jgi:DNA-directed RNA polymerase specialized sigma24 family protein
MIARNAVLGWVRTKRATPLDPSEIWATSASGSHDPEDWREPEQSRADVRSALTSLSPGLARSVVLAGAFDMTAAKVARYEHVPLSTAKTRIRVAKQRLRGRLANSGEGHVDETV